MLFKRQRQSRAHCGFTLVELLVVIAVIALLVAILLPALGKARTAAWRVASMSNLRQINIAAAAYKDDYRGYLPLAPVYARGTDGVGYDKPCGHCAWSYGGKNNDGYWASGAADRCLDVEAADRPLNPYLYPNVTFEAPPIPQQMASDAPERKALQLDIFQDPSDKLAAVFQSAGADISCYDNVGTSYLYNLKWRDYAVDKVGVQHHPFLWEWLRLGTELIRMADVHRPAKFVWVHDQFGTAISQSNDIRFRIVNGYGDVNKSVMAFLDGHVDYHPMPPGRQPRSFKNENYELLFELPK